MRLSVRLTGLALAGVLLAACGGVGGSTAATVNGEPIEVSTVEARLRAQSEVGPLAELTGEQRTEQLAQLQNQILTQIVILEIVDQAADEAGIEVTEEEVQAQWEEQAELQGGEEQLRSRIEEVGLTEAEARDQLAVGLKLERLQEELVGVDAVTDQEIRDLYEQRGDEWERADVSHILVETEEQAQQLVDQLEAGASFEELAREHSIDPGSAEQGGSLGEQPRGSYVEAFDQAVWNAQEGEIIGPVETEFGYHVIRVNGFSTTEFDEVSETLRQELEGSRQQEATRAVFEQLLAEATVEVSSRFGTWNAATGQIVAADSIDTVEPVTPQVPVETGTQD